MELENGYIIANRDEYKDIFGQLETGIKYPKNIEVAILKTVYEILGLPFSSMVKKPVELFNELPESFIEDVVETIDSMYMDSCKMDYSNKHLAYLMYYLPSNTHKIQRILVDILINDLLKADLKVLDIGCGPGSISIGLIEIFKNLAKIGEEHQFNLSIVSVDAEEEFINIAKSIIKKRRPFLPDNLKVKNKFLQHKIKSYTDFGKGPYDLIILSNFLNLAEMDITFNKVKLIEHLSKTLDPKGSLIIIEPGDNINCTDFKLLRNQIINNGLLSLYSPCNPQWESRSDYNCNCFSSGKIIWEKPQIIEMLIQNGLAKQRDDLAYNYAIFRKDKEKKYNPKSLRSFTRHDELVDNIDERVNIVGIVRCHTSKFGSYYVV